MATRLESFSPEPELDPIDLAWAAGFFDGEGTIGAKLRNVQRIGVKNRLGMRLWLQIGQVDPEVLYRFQAAVGGLGKVRGPYEYRGKVNGQDWYLYRAEGHDAVAIAQRLMPYLSSKKIAQAQVALQTYAER